MIRLQLHRFVLSDNVKLLTCVSLLRDNPSKVILINPRTGFMQCENLQTETTLMRAL